MKWRMAAQQRRRIGLDHRSDRLSLPAGMSGVISDKNAKILSGHKWGFGKFWDQTFMGIIRGPLADQTSDYYYYYYYTILNKRI